MIKTITPAKLAMMEVAVADSTGEEIDIVVGGSVVV